MKDDIESSLLGHEVFCVLRPDDHLRATGYATLPILRDISKLNILAERIASICDYQSGVVLYTSPPTEQRVYRRLP